jgi:NAD(P)H dehydrogenase (quinone)
MLVQVIHCHALTDSYNHALFRVIVVALEESGHQVVATDLYRCGFDRVMTPTERRSYYLPAYNEAAVSELSAVLRRVDGVIFCFPQWWFSLPAVLKGYFDRVWGPGIAFRHDPAGGRIVPMLTNIGLFGVVTSYGSPWWLTCFVASDSGRKLLMRALKPVCEPSTRSFCLAHYDMDRSTPASRARFLERVRQTISRL